MLISDSKKFMFIHIQKTGGTSLRSSLKELIPDLEEYRGTMYHARLSDALKMDPRLRGERYFTAVFVRNPWDRLVSWYSDICENTVLLPWWYKIISNRRYNKLRQDVLTRARSFEEFIYFCPEVTSRAGRIPFSTNQVDYLTNLSGEVAVDFIGRFENYEESVAMLLRALDLPEIRVSNVNKSRHDEYRTYYTEETREIVQNRFQRDIEEFGYTF